MNTNLEKQTAANLFIIDAMKKRLKTNLSVKYWCLFMLIFSSVNHVMAQTMPPLPANLQALQPENIFPPNAGESFTFRDGSKGPKPSTFTGVKQGDGSVLFTAEIAAPASSHYGIEAAFKSTKPVKRGDVLLARMNIHAVYAKQESGDGVVYFIMQNAIKPDTKSVMLEISVGPEWKTIDIPITADSDMDVAGFSFTLGALAQKIEITNIQVYNFGKSATIPQLPSTRLTYVGREEGAAWRKVALERIEKIRTAPLTIQVRDSKGKLVKGATVSARLVDPEFLFASEVSAHLLVNTDSTALTYQKHVKELFNAVTIGNGLKWPSWRNPKSREESKKAIDWILRNNLRLRGHNLVWPGRKFTPSPFNRLEDFGPGFSDSIKAHIKDIARYTKGKVYGWDVINELMHERDYFKAMPESEAVEWFKLAKQVDPNATLFINEYSMLNNVASPANIQRYLELIAKLRKDGAPIEAIGVQGHVGRQPRNPAQVLTDLDMFVATGLPVQITEFDINSPDEELQADYTRDFLIACYSHPAVNGFTMWGFWQGAHWKPDAAMFRKDWSVKPNLAAWKDLVLNKWRTTVSENTNGKGAVTAKGHLGMYKITVTKGKARVTKTYRLTKASEEVKIVL